MYSCNNSCCCCCPMYKLDSLQRVKASDLDHSNHDLCVELLEWIAILSRGMFPDSDQTPGLADEWQISCTSV